VSKRRVVVTGLGIASPIGLDEETLWSNMLSGRTGIARLKYLDIEALQLKTPNGAEIDTDDLTAAMAARDLRPLDRTVDMGLLVSATALEQAGLVEEGDAPAEAQPVGTLFGTGAGAAHSICEAWTSYIERGLRAVRPTTVPRCMASAISSLISIRYGLTGPNYVVICACSSATTAMGMAFRMIMDGYADQVLCGGTEAIFDYGSYLGWNKLGVMSKHQDPATACRPFDSDRSGCILGEGAGAFVFEELQTARARGARIRAEICGYGESSDAKHLTRPDAEGQATAMRAALESAGVQPGDLGYINAHGTATKANDSCECQSIRMVLGDAADRVPVGSSKSYFGHLLGASGAAETIATILALENGTIPANLNLDNPDPECNVCLAGSEPQAMKSPLAMKNSFGFGGQNAVLVLKRWEEAHGE